MSIYELPYGKKHLTLDLPDRADLTVQVLAPREAPAAPDPLAAVARALDAAPLPATRPGSVVIAVNDKTRPVPHHLLLPPLLERILALGVPPERTTLLIATGTHAPMLPDEFPSILPAAILARYPVYSHDCDAVSNLLALGVTRAGTPVSVNRRWCEGDLRIVVGNIEPHQFMGFSGGVKSAAVGLTGKETINTNHALMTALGADINCYDDNPCRQDVEEIGQRIGVHYALNAIINDAKQIAHVLAGDPRTVMAQGIPLLRRIYEVAVDAPFEVTFTAPGGHPKDINLYQAQKAIAHAARITRAGGAIVLVAACPEGAGSRAYENWILAPGMTSHAAVLARYAAEGYRIGPHKAWQISRDGLQHPLFFLSDMPAGLRRQLLFEPVDSLAAAVARTCSDLPPGARIGILPLANTTIPVLI